MAGEVTEVSFDGETYRLRASSPMPTETEGSFVLHTFMAEKSKITIISCTSDLPASSDFRGQGGDLMSASFSRLNVADGKVFSGKKTYAPTYIDEDEI